MMGGWRRAFCTSIPKERGEKDATQENKHHPSPRISSRLGFFSNPSTPRLQSQPVSSPSILCRPSASTPTKSLPSSPKLHCKTTSGATPSKNNSPVSSLFSFSSPSSPKSPSSFSLLKSTLRLSKSGGAGRCGICLQTVKSGQGTAIFTAECSHSFHFSCLATHPTANQIHKPVCPVCGARWRDPSSPSLRPRREPESKIREVKTKSLRVYNDDEPLICSPISLVQFNPIPESDENSEVEEDSSEFKGFFVVNASSPLSTAKNVEITLSPESVVVAAGRGHETHATVMKIKAPPFQSGGSRGPRRAPVDLVTVLDVGGDVAGDKIQMMKRAMRLIVSALRDGDRLSIIVFSASSKRLMPLRRMTANGRRSARRIVDAIAGAGKGMSVNDALKKAVKVVEDRRERNIVTSIIVLSDDHDSSTHTAIPENQNRWPFVVTTTSVSDTPVHTVSIRTPSGCDHALLDEAMLKCFTGLLSVPVQDLRLQLGLLSGSSRGEISSVYSMSARPAWLGSGSVRLGDLFSEEEREILVELRVPVSPSCASHHVVTVRSSYVDPTSQEHVHPKEQAILIPRPKVLRSSSAPGIRRLRNLHLCTRAVAESQRLIERDDLAGAHHLLSSARALLARSCSGEEYLRRVEAEIAALNKLRARHVVANEKAEPPPITPTSAWRAAERLAKVAMMRKHMNRVSDLHGFENARF